jgi:hypothetical protein
MTFTAPKPFVFVLMPFSDEFTPIYSRVIKKSCEDAGAYCERVDEQMYDGTILQRIFNQISKADLIVAEMTKRNANVFYETGYAHGLGRRVLLIVQKSEDIPFDLQHYPHIVYGTDLLFLKEELTRRVEWAINNPEKPFYDPVNALEFFIGGQSLLADAHVDIPIIDQVSSEDLVKGRTVPKLGCFKIEVHNSSNRTLLGSAFQIGVVLPYQLRGEIRSEHSVDLPGGKLMVLFDALGNLLPQGWRYFVVRINLQSLQQHKTLVHEGAIRVFSEVRSVEVPFTFSFV